MTQSAIGGPAQTTYRVTDRSLVTGRDAQRVFVVTDGRPAEGGPQQAVYYVSDAEIAAGEFVISGNKPIPISEVGAAGAEYPPIAVYVVTATSESDFPPVPDPAPPTPPGPVMLLDLEADTLVLSDGDPVALWADQSGNSNDFTQSGDARPTKQTVDNYSVISFDGLDDWMLGSNFADNLSSFTFVVVANRAIELSKIGNNGCDDPGSTGWDGSGGQFNIWTDSNNGILQATNHNPGGVKGIISYDMVSAAELHCYFNGALDDFYQNGGSVIGSGVSGFGNTEPVRLGIDGAAGDCDNFSFGNLYAVRIYAPALSSTERAAVEAELATRYGITL